MELFIYMKKIVHNFLHCGILGWCLEILFTALNSFRRRQFTLKGITSVWMFPIYGMASLLAPLCRLFKGKNILVRGLTYASLIFTGEYLTGKLLKQKELCPWDYSKARWNIGGIIRLDYLPGWFLTGLLFERLLLEADAMESHPAKHTLKNSRSKAS